MILLQYLVLCFGLISTAHASDCGPVPSEKIANIAKGLFSESANNFDFAKNNLIPNIDVTYMAKFIVGRYHWNQASKQDIDEFFTVYEKTLEKNYLKIINKHVSQFQFKLNKSSLNLQDDSFSINGFLKQIKKPKSLVTLYFHCSGTDWKLYDISIDNLYLLEQIKLQYATVIRHSGIKGLTQELKKKL